MFKRLDALQKVRKMTLEEDQLQIQLRLQREQAVIFIQKHYPERIQDGTEFTHKEGVFSVATRLGYDFSAVADTPQAKQLERKQKRKERLSAQLSDVNRDIYKLEREMAKTYVDQVKITPVYILHVSRKAAKSKKEKV